MSGSVYKRGSVWWIKVELGTDEKGKRLRDQRRGGATKKEAEALLTSIQARVSDGTYVDQTHLTISDFLSDSWLPAIRETVRPSTLASYQMIVEMHIVPNLGSMRLQSLTPARLNGFYADLIAQGRCDGKGGLSPKSVRNIHVVVHRALRDAVRWGLVHRNPADHADPPKLTQAGDREMKTWAPQEAMAFLNIAKNDRLYAGWLLAISSGMRRGELLGLRWVDVDLNDARLSVRQTVITVNYGIHFSTPKTARGRRSIALDRRTVESLRSHKRAQLEERLSIGPAGYADNDLVFCRVDGQPMHPDLFSQQFDRMVEKSSLPRIRLHDLRHTYATISLKAGIHAKVVSERLGHSTVSFTLDRYSHAVPGMQEDAAEKVADLIFGEF